VDDDRSSEALAETAAAVYRACMHIIEKEREAAQTEAAAAVKAENQPDRHALTPSTHSSSTQQQQHQQLIRNVLSELKRHVGSVRESDFRHCLSVSRDMAAVRTEMQSKYEKTKLNREIKRLARQAQMDGSGSEDDDDADDSGGLFMRKRTDATTSQTGQPSTLLKDEFGSDLMSMHDDAGDDDSSSTARRHHSSKRSKAHEVIRRLLGHGSSAAAAASSSTSLPIAVPPVSSDADSNHWDDDDDTSEYEYEAEYDSDSGLYVGESDEDDQEQINHRLSELRGRQVRPIHDSKLAPAQRAAPLPSSSTGPTIASMPSNPADAWTWLIQQCDRFVTYNEHGLPIVSAEELATRTLTVLQSASSRGEAYIQNELLDLLGFESLDLLQVLIQQRASLAAINSVHQSQARRRKAEREAQEMEARRQQQTADGSSSSGSGSAATVRGLVGVSIQTSAEIEMNRNRRRSDRRHARRSARDTDNAASSSRTQIDEAKLDAQASLLKPLISASGASQMISALPSGTVRTRQKGFEEVMIPARDRPVIDESKLLRIDEVFEPWAQAAFPRTKTLNRMQTRVYDAAYKHNNNLLICAPTGAGKTNVAMMCVLREIGHHIVNGSLQKDLFKIVYVAPMKALAGECQQTFQKRLAQLGIIVKELTGDMQLTKKELAETQIIVTTPEKWDVVTRKTGGDAGSSGTGLMALVKLLIIDEVHLLNEDRGPVLEILVARTLRLVESSQQMCRIVGLSATLPNYQDVAVFLKANTKNGLFHFDTSYRPVPLQQTFIGVTEPNQVKRIQAMNEITYKKVLASIRESNQVMIFVHSRRDTVKTAQFMREAAMRDGSLPLFDMTQDPHYPAYERKLMRSRNADLKELFPSGFAVHHAGMVRSDRSMVEAAFSAGLIRCLVCTATLAWGVNLPAHTVILKGTQIYNAQKGAFTSVGALDVQQIFGRAGRPQFDDSGEAILVCSHDELAHYVGMLTHQLPIESQFEKELPNHLNAEIILGTVTTLNEAVEWLAYTYLYTRMLRNPLHYGIKFDDMQYDESLLQRRRELIIAAAKLLMRCRMIKFDSVSGQFYSTYVGRVASHYYIHYESVELYNEMLKPVMTDEEVLHLLACSKEFSQLKLRDEEVSELEKVAKRYAPIKIAGGLTSDTGKQNCLLQVYISNGILDAQTLISDSYFIQQSAGRICRALFEMVLRRGRAVLASKFLEFAKMIELRIWNFQTPLRQFLTNRHNRGEAGAEQRGGLLKMHAIMAVESRNLKLDQLIEMDAKEINALLKHSTLGHTIAQCLRYIPYLTVASCNIQPITRSVLRIEVELQPDFDWTDKQHGMAETFWIWIEEADNQHIYHSEQFTLHKNQMNEIHKLTFTIPIQEPLPPQYWLRIVSDRWLGSDQVEALDFQALLLPETTPSTTQLLDLHPLPRSALMNSRYESMYDGRFTHFNPVQTQVFHTMYHTDENVLLGAPTGSGKTIVAELAMLRLFTAHPGRKVVYIAPLKALARERIQDWSNSKSFAGKQMNKRIVELTGDTAPDQKAIVQSDIIITTPEKFDGVSRNWSSRPYVRQVGLVIIDEIHLLGADRGPVLEVLVSRMRYISSHTSSSIRIVGLSTALSNARDLADWLGIERAGLFNFPPSVRPVPLTIHISGHAGRAYCARMASMNKPTYAAIQTHSPNKPVLVFVSSRRQTRLTALDLIAFSAADGNPRKWLHMNDSELQSALKHVSDPNLRHMLAFGIGIHHAGLANRDRMVVEKLFLTLKMQVLVCTSTLAWGVNFPCHLVVVKGTEYYDAKVKRYVDFPITDVLQMIGRAGRPQFDSDAKAVVLVEESKKNFYLNFLHNPFPVESSLLGHLHDHVNAEICSSGTIASLNDFLDYLSWTFFFRRLLLNPTFYGLEGLNGDQVQQYLMKLVESVVNDLDDAGLIMYDRESRSLTPLPLGKIASYYYLSYRTIIAFSERLEPQGSVESLLSTLAHAAEYDELPVRHNEEHLNADLAKDVRWRVDSDAFDSPHTKCHLLLQAHLARLDLPIADYFTDLKSVLDQAIRIIHALIDTTAEAGWFSTTRNGMTLMQMVVQGRWHDDPTIANVPAVNNNDKLLHALRTEKLLDIKSLIAAPRQKVEKIYRRCGVSEKETTEAIEMLSKLPIVSMTLPASAAANASSSSSSSSPTVSSPLPCSSSYTLRVSLRRHHSSPTSSLRIFTPVFSKPKDEGWWIVVAYHGAKHNRTHTQTPHHTHTRNTTENDSHDETEQQQTSISDADELVAIKRINNLKGRKDVDLTITLPSMPGTHAYSVQLVSDSYLGFDIEQRLELTTV